MVSGWGPKDGNGGVVSFSEGYSFTLTSNWLAWRLPSTSGRDYWLESNVDGVPLSIQHGRYCQGCSFPSYTLAANKGWQIQIFILEVLIRITATCPSLGVTELEFTTTPDGKLLCAANSIIYDPLVTSSDTLPGPVIIALPRTHIGWWSLPIVMVLTGVFLFTIFPSLF